jgi:hypothetical protein
MGKSKNRKDHKKKVKQRNEKIINFEKSFQKKFEEELKKEIESIRNKRMTIEEVSTPTPTEQTEKPIS